MLITGGAFRNVSLDSVLANWNYYIAFGFFRITAILQGVYRRAHDGQVRW